jgi:hypothetical protein
MISTKLSISSSFNIEELELFKPTLYNGKIQCRIQNIKPLITINNASLIKDKLINKNINYVNCIANLELQNFFLILQNRLQDLFNKYLENGDTNFDFNKELHFDPIIKFNNTQIVSKINFNRSLKLVEDLDFNNKFNIFLELHSMIQDNNIIKILWKLKSLEVIESLDNNNISDDDIEILNYKMSMIRNNILTDSKKQLNCIKEKYNNLENIYNNMLNENNIDKLKILQEQFLDK